MALTPKQQRFVQEYLTDLNATQAAIRCGYSEHTAKQQGSRLLTNAAIAEAIAAGQIEVAGRLGISAEKVLRDIEATRKAAAKDGQYASALRASELQGKHIGMFVERRETTITDKRMVVEAPAQADSAEEWASAHGPH